MTTSLRSVILLFAIGFFIGLVWHLPASVVLAAFMPEDTMVEYEQSYGTAWAGRLQGGSVGLVPIGAVQYSVNPFQLMLGLLGVDWTLRSSTTSGSGTLVASAGHLRLANTELSIPLQDAQLLVPMTGGAQVEVTKLVLTDGECEAAEGRILLVGALEAHDRSAFRVSGAITCAGDMLAIDLSGEVGQSSAEIEIIQSGQNRAQIQVRMSDVPASQAIALTSLGFQRDGSTYELVQSVQIR